MPKVYKLIPTIGAYIPVTDVPCFRVPGREGSTPAPDTCIAGVPYEVVAEHTTVYDTNNPPSFDIWLGLRPQHIKQDHLDWVLFQDVVGKPNGIYLSTQSFVDDGKEP